MSKLDAATAAYREVAQQLETEQQNVVAAIITARRAGGTPSVVAKHSPFTDSYVRQLSRKHGLPPGSPGPKAGKDSPSNRPAEAADAGEG